jgi:TRAP-type C4-dicarboxylate transport system permease small subunit
MTRFNAAVERVGFVIASLLLLAMTTIIGLQVFSRKVLHETRAWTTEVAIQAMVWMGLIGAALCVRTGSHIAVQMVERHMPPRLRRVAGWAVTIGQTLTGIILAVWGVLLALSLRGATTPGAKIPWSLSYVVLPISGVMTILFSLERRLSPPRETDHDG